MTLNDIIIAALDRLDRGSDTQMIDHYRPAYTNYANRAVKMIADKYKEVKKESVQLDANCTFDISTPSRVTPKDVHKLSRLCERIVKIKNASGTELSFSTDIPGSGEIIVSGAEAEETVYVYYRFVPNELTSYSDVPDIPTQYHDMIPYYIVALEKQSGDWRSYKTSTPEWQTFMTMLQSVKSPYLGSSEQFRLKNYH